MPTVAIDAKQEWNKTGIRLQAGRSYRFAASGEWWDASHRCGPDGYRYWKLVPFIPWRRFSGATWFTLIGTIEGSDPFAIGLGCLWTAPRDGELWCYANDVPGYYANNEGSVTLTVEEA